MNSLSCAGHVCGYHGRCPKGQDASPALQELTAQQGRQIYIGWRGVMNVANKTSHFNGSSQEAQSPENVDIKEEQLFEMVRRPMIRVSKGRDWQVHWTGKRVGEMQGEKRKQYTLN